MEGEEKPVGLTGDGDGGDDLDEGRSEAFVEALPPFQLVASDSSVADASVYLWMLGGTLGLKTSPHKVAARQQDHCVSTDGGQMRVMKTDSGYTPSVVTKSMSQRCHRSEQSRVGLTRRANSSADGTERQAAWDARLLACPLCVSELDPLESGHVDARVRCDANEARRQAAKVQLDASRAPHVDRRASDEGVAGQGAAGRRHDTCLERLDRVDDCESVARVAHTTL